MKIDHWRNAAFLAGTLLVIAAELVHAFDGDSGTRPWTDYLTQLPLPILVPAAVAFSVWLVLHLVSARIRKTRDGGDS